ncbi:hypothetical protein [Agrobacterium sp. Ap1]|nr:hypothetical protein [Agrobacterium sp. Ap1]
MNYPPAAPFWPVTVSMVAPKSLALDRQPVDIRVVVFPLMNWK